MTAFGLTAALLAASGLVFLLPPLWGATRRARVVTLATAFAFPLLVAAIYLAVGTPAALQRSTTQHATSQEQVLAMVTRLAERMRTTPEDTDGWIMLGRSYAAIGRFADAAAAYERVAEQRPDDARLLADSADVAAMAQGRRFEGKPEALIRRALAADPNNIKALSLAGTVEYDRGNFAAAIAHWRRILPLVPPGSEAERTVRASIAEAETRGGLTAKLSVEGRLELSRSALGRVQAGDTVFIFARVPGERMPLAMLRRRAADLPLDFRLDDTMAMNPAAKLSDAKLVEVVARISRSGSAALQAGDMETISRKVRPGTRDVRLTIK